MACLVHQRVGLALKLLQRCSHHAAVLAQALDFAAAQQAALLISLLQQVAGALTEVGMLRQAQHLRLGRQLANGVARGCAHDCAGISQVSSPERGTGDALNQPWRSSHRAQVTAFPRPGHC